jgi:hypothetical protein
MCIFEDRQLRSSSFPIGGPIEPIEISSLLNHIRCVFLRLGTTRNLKVFAHRPEKKCAARRYQSVRQTAPSNMDPTPPVTTPDSSSSEFSSADFTPIGRLFQQPNLAEKQAEEVESEPVKCFCLFWVSHSM